MQLNRPEFITMALAAGSSALLPISDAFADPPTPITSLPTVITAAGSYILNTNLSVSLEFGAAIQVVASNVTIDLNGKSVSNTGASSLTQAVGIMGLSESLTVKNGTVKGFYVGVKTRNPTNIQLGGNEINLVQADRCLGAGFMLDGSGNAVRNCSVTNQGRSTAGTRYNCLYSFGIVLNHGTSSVITGNAVYSSGYSTNDTSVGIYMGRYARDTSVLSNQVTSARIGYLVDPQCRCEIGNNRAITSAYPYYGNFVNLGGNT